MTQNPNLAALSAEDEGVEKFEKSWLELLEATRGQLDARKSSANK
jgi:transaldolase